MTNLRRDNLNIVKIPAVGLRVGDRIVHLGEVTHVWVTDEVMAKVYDHSDGTVCKHTWPLDHELSVLVAGSRVDAS